MMEYKLNRYKQEITRNRNMRISCGVEKKPHKFSVSSCVYIRSLLKCCSIKPNVFCFMMREDQEKSIFKLNQYTDTDVSCCWAVEDKFQNACFIPFRLHCSNSFTSTGICFMQNRWNTLTRLMTHMWPPNYICLYLCSACLSSDVTECFRASLSVTKAELGWPASLDTGGEGKIAKP
jgi:hypothetical protein